MSYLIRRVLAKPRLILDEMCRLYGTFASYLIRVLCKTRLILPRINGLIVNLDRSKFGFYRFQVFLFIVEIVMSILYKSTF